MRLLVEQPQLHNRVCLSLTWYNLSWEKGGLYSHGHKQFSIVFITGRTYSCHKRQLLLFLPYNIKYSQTSSAVSPPTYNKHHNSHKSVEGSAHIDLLAGKWSIFNFQTDLETKSFRTSDRTKTLLSSPCPMNLVGYCNQHSNEIKGTQPGNWLWEPRA